MMDTSQTPRHDCRSCRYLTLCRGVLDLSIIQGPFSITKCQILVSRFRNFFIAVSPQRGLAIESASVWKARGSGAARALRDGRACGAPRSTALGSIWRHLAAPRIHLENVRVSPPRVHPMQKVFLFENGNQRMRPLLGPACWQRTKVLGWRWVQQAEAELFPPWSYPLGRDNEDHKFQIPHPQCMAHLHPYRDTTHCAWLEFQVSGPGVV
jgi:hypothetical protein